MWTPDDKRRLVAEMSVPGANVSEIARRHGVANSLLYRWRQDAEGAERQPPKQPGSVVEVDISPVFVPVAIVASPQKRLPSPKIAPPRARRAGSGGEAKSCGTIDVVLANGRSVRVGADVDTAALVRIVTALEKAG